MSERSIRLISVLFILFLSLCTHFFISAKVNVVNIGGDNEIGRSVRRCVCVSVCVYMMTPTMTSLHQQLACLMLSVANDDDAVLASQRLSMAPKVTP